MNIEAFNTDTLRKLVRNLQDENKKLKEKLDEANIPYEEINLFEQPINKSAEYDPDHMTSALQDNNIPLVCDNPMQNDIFQSYRCEHIV
jgi:hypothetical protein